MILWRGSITKKCRDDTFPVSNAIKQIRFNHWTLDKRKTESQWGNLGSYICTGSDLIFKSLLISLLQHPSKLQWLFHMLQQLLFILFSIIDVLV